MGQKITDVTIRLRKLIKSNPRTFRRQLRGQRIGSLARRGKLLIVELEGSNRYLLLHLKMTGQLIYRHGTHVIAGGHSQGAMSIEDLPNKYTHLIFTLSDGAQLFFNDLRQFGYVKVVNAQQKEDELSVYGVEPLAEAFTPALLLERLAARRVPVKSVLLDQSVIAGLGNIYVDEVCFYAGVRPDRPAHQLTRQEAAALHRGIRHILRLAIKHRGTTFNNYRDAHGRRGNFVRRLNVYGRTHELCRRCKRGKIVKTKLAGRGTHYCPHCQR